MASYFLASVQPPFWYSCDFADAELSLYLLLVDSSLLAFLPALEEYSENTLPKPGPLTSTQHKQFD